MTHLIQLLIAIIVGIATSFCAIAGGAVVVDAPPESTLPTINESAAAEAAAGFDTDPLAVATALPAEILPSGYLLLPRVGNYQRAPLHIDPIEAAIARGKGAQGKGARGHWPPPAVGKTVRSATGKIIPWFAETDPLPLSALSGGYAYAEFVSPSAGILLLEAPGCAAVWLNDEWIVGDPYGVGWFRPPVQVREGRNRLLLHLARPTARAKFIKPPADVFLIADQATLPDVLFHDGEQESASLLGSIPLVNATNEPLEGLEVLIGESGTPRPLPTIAPRMVFPIAFTIPSTKKAPKGDSNKINLSLIIRQTKKPDTPSPQTETGDEDSSVTATTTVATVDLVLRCVAASALHVRTYVSSVDGSVQPYSVLPATGQVAEGGPVPMPEGKSPGVLLVLHDAGEEHATAAQRCQPLSDLHVVLPCGRGAYGFDWEDWSATDALESLADFQSHVPVDADRISVTGHGMGGHGALHLGTIAPDRFAAVAPVGAWLSFYTQGSAPPPPGPLPLGLATPDGATPIETVLARRASAADPMRALENLAHVGVSVGHGWADRTVALAESHLLRRRLSEFHTDFAYREAQGTGAVRPGSPLVDFCRWHRRTPADERNSIDFATHDLGLLTELGWARIDEQAVQGDLSHVRLKRNLTKRKIAGTTGNVRRLTLRLNSFEPDEPITVRLDGEKSILFDWPRRGGALQLEQNDEGHWKKSSGSGRRSARKRAARPGGFKSVFANNPLLVYGTSGSDEAKKWSLAKARYDAMLFLYRGRGRLEVVADTEFDPTAELGRNVVLYGSDSTNKSLKTLFGRSPIKVAEGKVNVGPRPEQGKDLSVLLLRPRPGSPTASIALIGGTGPVGWRSTTRLRYFWSGVVYPDFLLFGPAAIDTTKATSKDRFRGDIRAAGDFGSDWKIETGDIPWRDIAL